MDTSFLQSKAWGEFQTAVGHRTIQFATGQGFEHRLGLGMKYLYCPRVQPQAFNIQSLGELKKQGFLFVRVEPIAELSAMSYELSATPNRQPQHTLFIDLSKSEVVLLDVMHPKTRYNIHLAERHGVLVKEEKNADIFWRLHEETAQRDAFRGHPRVYYEKMLDLPIVKQLTAYHGYTPIASHLLVIYEGASTYLHGASANHLRNLMAPYLLQWEGMKLGKREGCARYDFWGVAPPTQTGATFHGYTWDSTHPWSGVTRFKAGFGGLSQSYPQAIDIVLSPIAYRLYRAVRTLRGMV